MESKGSNNINLPWPFPDGEESSMSEPTGPEVDPIKEPERIAWKLEELPVEVRLDFLRRIRIGWSIIDGALQLKNPHNDTEETSGSRLRAIAILLILFLGLGALGSYFEAIIFFYIGLLPLILMAYISLDDLSIYERRLRQKQNNSEILLDLRQQWLANGFSEDDFDTLVLFDKSKDQEIEVIARWWSLVQLHLLVMTRLENRLPELENAPSWKFLFD